MGVACAAIALFLTFAGAQVLSETPDTLNVQQAEVPGIANFSSFDPSTGFAGSSVGFGGATQASAMPWLRGERFATVINLRLASEEGAAVERSRAAAAAAGLKYIHLPFDPRNPTPDLVNDFLRVVGEKANQPVYIHCNSATRVAALWLIGRVREDGWEFDDAAKEARAIAQKPDEAIGFASAYLRRGID